MTFVLAASPDDPTLADMLRQVPPWIPWAFAVVSVVVLVALIFAVLRTARNTKQIARFTGDAAEFLHDLRKDLRRLADAAEREKGT